MKQGTINVQTENIFPIIKKFLYSEHDIFLRELISNAVDAAQKLKTLSSLGETKSELGDLRIDVKIDKDKKTITISDNGIGMSEDEVEKYINQVAFSGAEEFVQKYEDKASIIGHFGLGFYSSFMVSDKVEIQTQSHRADEAPVKWSCDGSPNFKITKGKRKTRGTDVILHVNDESLEFLEPHKIQSTLQKFCKFLPIPIYFEDKQINNTHPAWTKKPTELKDEDYINFYKELYPFHEEPLFWIHLNVDYPFNLTGILYFPKIKNSYEMLRDKINLYSNQVYVTDEVSDIVPEYLMLLHGVIDSPDIPLNVSRSYLQGDPNVRKINSHISKKVVDKLEEMYKNDRKSYEEKWDSISLFVKYGMITDDKFFERAQNLLIMEDAMDKGKFYSMDEYKNETSALQVNKDGKHVVLYASDPEKQSSYLSAAAKRNYKTVLLNSIIDPAFVQNIEMKWNDVQFKRIDADLVDHLIDKDDTLNLALTDSEKEELQSLFKREIPQLNLQIIIEGLSPESAPITATKPEWMRRIKEMSQTGGGGMASFYGNMPDELELHINGNNSMIQSILKDTPADQQKKIDQLIDLSLLSQDMLTSDRLTQFIDRNIEMMNN